MDEYLNTKDGKRLFIYSWNEVEKPKAMIQIFHGMAEHSARYHEFAEFLNREGFIVYASDHRGHGKTVGSRRELGYIGHDGFNLTVEDKHLIFEKMKNEHPELPLFLFGHSYGSFLAQEYILRYGNELDGVVLSGSAFKKGAEINIGRFIALAETKIYGEKNKSKLLLALSFGSYNKKFKSDGYRFAWLSSDLEEVKKYHDDPYCGRIFTSGFYLYFLRGLGELYKSDRLKILPPQYPIMIIAGGADPVGDYEKSVKKLYDFYKNSGDFDAKIIIYPGLRHEILNEINKNEVYKDVSNWLNYVILKNKSLEQLNKNNIYRGDEDCLK